MKNYGFKRPLIKIEDHIYGAADVLPVIQPDGQWDNYLPKFESQDINYETAGCTVFGSQNAIEMLFRKEFNIEPNYDERYNYNISEINPEEGGADPNKVIQDMREKGLIQGFLSHPDTLEEFMTPRPMSPEYLTEGAKWVKQYDLQHKWVLQGSETKKNRISLIQDALTKGPVCVSVSAWFPEGDIFVDYNQPNNHWTLCYGWTGNGWKIFDSYDNSTKIYSFDSKIDFAKLILLKKKPSSTSTLQKIINFLKKIFT